MADGRGPAAILNRRAPRRSRTNSSARLGLAESGALQARRDRILSTALTLYAVLWIVEGAVRKWVPGMENVFYVLRDGLLLGALVLAALIAPMAVRRQIGVAFWGVCTYTAIVALYQSLVLDIPTLVSAIGVRNVLAPLLPIYIVIRYRPPLVWRNIAIVIMAFAPVEAVLAALQASSPATAAINKQLGDDGASFTTAFGVVRASGTFSSPIGLTSYVAVLFAVGVAAVGRISIKLPLVYVGLVSSVMIIALSGSRGALVYAGVVAVGWLASLFASSQMRRASVSLLAIVAMTFVVASVAFPLILRAFQVRISTASDAGSVDERISDSAFGFIQYSSSVFGDGIGVHGNAGIRLGSGAMWIEDENTRLVAELGLVGYAIIFARFLLAAAVLYWLVARARTASPIVATTGALVAYSLVVGGMTTQPTSQGFFALAASIAISAYLETRWHVLSTSGSGEGRVGSRVGGRDASGLRRRHR